MAGDRRRRRHGRAHQMGAPPRPWRPSKLRFEVEAQPLARLQLVRVHRQATSSSRVRASRSRRRGRPRPALRTRPGPSPDRAWHHHGRRTPQPPCGPWPPAAAAAQILDAAVGAGADEDPVDAGGRRRLAGLKAHIVERVAHLLGLSRLSKSAGSGNASVDLDYVFRAGAPGDGGLQRRDIDPLPRGRNGRPNRSGSASSGPAPWPSRRPWARPGGRRDSEAGRRSGGSARPAPRPRWSGCTRVSAPSMDSARSPARHIPSRSRRRRPRRSGRSWPEVVLGADARGGFRRRIRPAFLATCT